MKSYNYLLPEDIDRDNLVNNEEFIDDAAEYIFKRTDGELDLTDPDEIYDEFMERMRKHDVNEVDTISDLMYAQEAEGEDKETMSRLFSVYDKMEMSFEDFGEKVLDYGEGILTAPSTLAGVFTGGSAKVASIAGQQATKALVRRALSSGLKAGAVEAVIGAGQNVGQQATRMELDPEREFSGTELAITTAASALPGVVIGGAQGARKASQVIEAQQLEQEAARGLARANLQAQENAADTIAKASKDNPADVEEAEEIINELKPFVDETEKLDPLDPLRVERGEEIKAGIETPEGFEIRIPPEKLKQLVAAVLELKAAVPRNKGERITTAVSRAMGDGIIPKEIFSEIMEKYNLSGRDIGLILEADMSSYGRALQAMGQLKKDHYGRMKTLIDSARNIAEETGAGRESANYMNELAQEGNIQKLLNGLNSGERLRRTIMTSQPVTTVRNFFGGGARLTLDVFEDFVRASTNTLYNGLIGAAPKLAKKFGLEKAEARSVFNSADIGKYLFNKPEAELIIDMFRNIDQEGYERFFQGFVDASSAGKKIGSGGFLQKTGNFFNYFNKMSDNFYKKAAFAGELSRIVKAKYGKELVDVIKDGEFNKIDPKIFNEAMDKGFELLYQKTPKGTGLFARAARGYLKLDKNYGFLAGMLIPFPRFVINQIQFMYEHVPVLGMLPLEKIGAKAGTKISYADKFAKTVSGAAMMHYFYSLRASQGPGTQWYEVVDEDGNKKDLRPFLGPMNLELYMADLMYRSKKYGINEPMPQMGDVTREVFQTAVGSSLRAGTGLYLIDQAIPEILDQFDGEKPSIQLNKTLGRIAGDYLNTYTLLWPVSVAKDLYSLTDEELRRLGNTTGGVDMLDIIELRATRSLGPFVGIGEDRYDILSTEPLRRKDPLRTAVTGLNISKKSNPVQKEAIRLQIEPYEIYRSFKFGPADTRIRKDVSQRLEPLMLSFIRTKEYQSLSDEDKTVQFLKKAKSIIAQNYQPTLQILTEEARMMEREGFDDETIKKVIGYSENDINQFQYENMTRRVQRAVEAELGAPTDDSNFAEYLRLAEAKKGLELASGGLVQKFADGGMPTPMDEQMDALSLSEAETAGEEPQSLSGVIGKIAEVGGDVWENMNYLDRAALVTAPVPVLGDVTGLIADAYMYATKPEERTALNYSLTGAGLVGGLPASVTSAIGSSPALLGIFGAARRNPEALKRYEEAMNAPLTKEQEKLIADDPNALADIMLEKAENVYAETGVLKHSDIGMDQIPRIEYDDSTANLKITEVKSVKEPNKTVVDEIQPIALAARAKPLTIGDLLQYDDLFKAYPEARNIRVVPYTGDGKKSYGGSFEAPTQSKPYGGIALNPNMTPQEVKSVLVHELQHYVQFMDYLYEGSNKKLFMPEGIEDLEKVLDNTTVSFANMLSNATTAQGFNPLISAKNIINPSADWKTYDSATDESAITRIMRTIGNKEDYASKRKVIQVLEESIGKEQTDEFIAHARRVKKLQNIKERAFGNYMSTSGEVEARFAQHRMNMTMEERLAEMPNVSMFFDAEAPRVLAGRPPKTTIGSRKASQKIDDSKEKEITQGYLEALTEQNQSVIDLAKELDRPDIVKQIKDTMAYQKKNLKVTDTPSEAMSEVLDAEMKFRVRKSEARTKRAADIRDKSAHNELPEEFGGFRIGSEVDVPGYGPGKIGQINYNKAGEPSIMVSLNRDEAPIAVGMSVSEALDQGVKITKEAPIYQRYKVKVDTLADPYREFIGERAYREIAQLDDPELKQYYDNLEIEEYQNKVYNAYKEMWLERTGKKPNPDVTERNPIMENAAKRVKEGTLDVEEFRAIADQQKPVKVWKEMPEMATFEDMVFALNEKQIQSPFIGYNKTIKDGTKISARLDIPAYTRYDTWVVALRGPKDVADGKMMYSPAVRLKNVDLTQTEKQLEQAMEVAAGRGKGPFAVMEGEYVEETAEATYNLAKEALKSDEWIQVGFDPTRRGYFYDRKTMEPVLNAEEILQVGPLVLAKKAVKGDAKDFKFATGGLMSRR